MQEKMSTEAPQVIEMEKFVLGAMLLKDGEVIPNVSAILDADDFYRPEHRIIYQAILKIYNKKIIPNVLSLAEELRSVKDEKGQSLLDKITLTYVLGIVEIAHTTAYAETYAKNIKQKSELRKIYRLSAEVQQAAELGVVEPADVAYEFAEKLQHFICKDKSQVVPIESYIKQKFLDDVEARQKYNTRKTGFSNIDEFQIFSPGVYVLGASPACGKTTFCWQLAEKLSKKGEKCIFCSYEMSALELASKSLARELFVQEVGTLSAADLRAGGFNYKLTELIDSYKSTVDVIECTDEKIDDLLKMLTPYCLNAAPVIFIDYLQIIPGNDREDAKTRIDSTMRKLKIFQRRTNATFVIVSSFNRSNYSATVGFEGFKESGAIEYSADVIWAMQLYAVNQLKDAAGVNKTREVLDAAKKQQPRQIELSCLKNRQGNNYTVYFEYYSKHDFFAECTEKTFKTSGSPADNKNIEIEH